MYQATGNSKVPGYDMKEFKVNDEGFVLNSPYSLQILKQLCYLELALNNMEKGKI